jgi:YD repeat-containing protein
VETTLRIVLRAAVAALTGTTSLRMDMNAASNTTAATMPNGQISQW